MTKGQRVVTSSHLVASENVQEPGQILIGVTSPGGIGDALQQSWKDGTLAEYVLLPAETITPIEGLDDYSLPPHIGRKLRTEFWKKPLTGSKCLRNSSGN